MAIANISVGQQRMTRKVHFVLSLRSARWSWRCTKLRGAPTTMRDLLPRLRRKEWRWAICPKISIANSQHGTRILPKLIINVEVGGHNPVSKRRNCCLAGRDSETTKKNVSCEEGRNQIRDATSKWRGSDRSLSLRWMRPRPSAESALHLHHLLVRIGAASKGETRDSTSTTQRSLLYKAEFQLCATDWEGKGKRDK